MRSSVTPLYCEGSQGAFRQLELTRPQGDERNRTAVVVDELNFVGSCRFIKDFDYGT